MLFLCGRLRQIVSTPTLTERNKHPAIKKSAADQWTSALTKLPANGSASNTTVVPRAVLNNEKRLSTDEAAAEEAAAALAAVENEAGRTTDPVRMYMREMGTVELLTREGEIVIAKRIEEGLRDVMAALAHYPDSVITIIDVYKRIFIEEGRLSDLFSGYIDPDGEPNPSPINPTTVVKSDDDDDEEETDNGNR